MELKDKVDLMAKVYCKGFNGSTASVYLSCDNCFKEGKREKDEKHIALMLNHVETHYKNLDYPKLEADSDFAPIFVVAKLLPVFSKYVNKFLEGPTSEMLKEIHEQQRTMANVGGVYQSNFNQRLSELRNIPDYENYKVKMVDTLTGVEWEF